jgi:hypothetical protein
MQFYTNTNMSFLRAHQVCRINSMTHINDDLINTFRQNRLNSIYLKLLNYFGKQKCVGI